MKPLVSIVIPVYNGESYLREAIDSALAQTYKPIEVLVINDGSTDKTEEIVLSYGDRIRYFSKENGGVSTALNTGIANMRGEYFSWLSHDDLYQPEKIEREIEAVSDCPLCIAYSDYTVIDGRGRVVATVDIAKRFPDADTTFGLFPILRQVLNGCTLLIHKSYFERAGVFDEGLRTTQDYDLWFRMLRGVKLAYINEPLVMMREHGAQVTHRYKDSLMEADALWLSMLKSVSAEETCKIDGTEWNFWDYQTEFLWRTHYVAARNYARDRLKALGGGKVSVEKLAGRAYYQMLSGASRFTRALGIQNTIRRSRLFKWGYKMWLGARYK